jgi:hypothetical protein
MARIRVPPSGPFAEVLGGSFMSGSLVPAAITLSDGAPGPTSVVVTLAALADVAGLTGVQVSGWADIDMSVDETGDPAASDGTLLLEVSWDGGATFEAATAKFWKGGGTGNPSTELVPLFAASKAGPATGDVQLRLTFSGEPVGGAEALTITLTSELGAVFA